MHNRCSAKSNVGRYCHGVYVAQACCFSLCMWQFHGFSIKLIFIWVGGTELWSSTKPKPITDQAFPLWLIQARYGKSKITVPLTHLKPLVSFNKFQHNGVLVIGLSSFYLLSTYSAILLAQALFIPFQVSAISF